MKYTITDIEYGDDGCPTCGSHDGDYGGTYGEPPESVEIEIPDDTKPEKIEEAIAEALALHNELDHWVDSFTCDPPLPEECDPVSHDD